MKSCRIAGASPSHPRGGRSTGGGASHGRAEAGDFSIVHVLDKASAKLFGACTSGEHIKEVKLELCRATKDKQKYMDYTMSHVLVSSVRPGGSSKGEESLPLEEVTFNFAKMEETYTVTAHDTGKPSGDIKANYDWMTNKGGKTLR